MVMKIQSPNYGKKTNPLSSSLKKAGKYAIVGSALQGATSAFVIDCLKKEKCGNFLSKFLITVDLFGNVSAMSKKGLNPFKYKDLIIECLPKTFAINAAICAGIGGAIGLISALVKNAKIKKEDKLNNQ